MAGPTQIVEHTKVGPKRRDRKPVGGQHKKWQNPRPSSTQEGVLGDGYYEALRLEGERIKHGRMFYKVRWFDKSTTWEPEENLNRKLLDSWKKYKAQRMKGKRSKGHPTYVC